MKKNCFVFGLTVLLMAAMVIACDNGTAGGFASTDDGTDIELGEDIIPGDDPEPGDPKAGFYGTWRLAGTLYLTLSADKVLVQSPDAGAAWHYEAVPVIWEEVVNTNPATKAEYPSGYRITGIISASTFSSGVCAVGRLFGNGFAYYMGADSGNMIEQEDSPKAVALVYIR